MAPSNSGNEEGRPSGPGDVRLDEPHVSSPCRFLVPADDVDDVDGVYCIYHAKEACVALETAAAARTAARRFRNGVLCCGVFLKGEIRPDDQDSLQKYREYLGALKRAAGAGRRMLNLCCAEPVQGMAKAFADVEEQIGALLNEAGNLLTSADRHLEDWVKKARGVIADGLVDTGKELCRGAKALSTAVVDDVTKLCEVALPGSRSRRRSTSCQSGK